MFSWGSFRSVRRATVRPALTKLKNKFQKAPVKQPINSIPARTKVNTRYRRHLTPDVLPSVSPHH